MKEARLARASFFVSPNFRSWLYKFAPSLAFAAILLLIAVAYHPALSGGFLFDDYANLPALGEHGGIGDFDRAAIFVLSGIAGPTGRPISLASFLLDALNWPADPAPFKVHNLEIHLLCTCLVAWLTQLLADALGHMSSRASWASVWTAMLWGLHPFWLSTVMYPVQRMTLLSTFFCLAGLVAYLLVRKHLQNRPTMLFPALLGVLGLFTPLAALSKENGALLPLLAGCLEVTVLAANPRRPEVPTIWGSVLLVVPLLAVVGFCIAATPAWYPEGLANRNFTGPQRVLTESRILWTYVAHLLIPRMQTAGLYQDNYAISVSLLQPWTTMPACLGWIAATAWAWTRRKSQPLAAGTIFFYLGGQLLESGWVPLELYFEHRNYLPSVAGFSAAGIGLATAGERHPRLEQISAIAAFTILTTLTALHARLWADTDRLFLTWAALSPDSARAQQQASLVALTRADANAGGHFLAKAVSHHSDDLYLLSFATNLSCEGIAVYTNPVPKWISAMQTGVYSPFVYGQIARLMDRIEAHACRSVDNVTMIRAAGAGLTNPRVAASKSAQQQLLLIRARAHAGLRDFDGFDHDLWAALAVAPSYDRGMMLAAIAASHGRYAVALKIVDTVKILVERDLRRPPRSRADLVLRCEHPLTEISQFRTQILSDQARHDGIDAAETDANNPEFVVIPAKSQ